MNGGSTHWIKEEEQGLEGRCRSSCNCLGHPSGNGYMAQERGLSL